jgi:2-methylcitrate dehydratase PrpD
MSLGENVEREPAIHDTETARAARFVASLDAATIPPEVAEKARCCILYGFGIGLLCLGQETARVAEQSLLAVDGTAGARGATSLRGGHRVSISSAVFANAVLLHSRCQEDTSGTAHLGVITLSVALALLEAGLAEQKDVIAGLVAGYEVAGGLEAALGRDTMSAGFRASSIYGAVAAAATAARLLRLPRARTEAALANALGFAGGTLQSIPEGSDEWRYQVGAAARSGVLAAFLARSGSISARESIEGPQGFAQSFGRRALSPGELAFGKTWRLLDVTFKPYPVCAHNQTIALLGAKIHALVPAHRIAALRLSINPYVVPGLLARGPFSRVSETLLSAYFCAAVASLHGTVTLAHLADVNDPAVSALMQRITLTLDNSVAFPAALADVETFEGETLHLSERREFADFSLGRDDVKAQLRRLAAEENVPTSAVDRLDAFAFGLPSAAVSDIARAFDDARASLQHTTPAAPMTVN